MSQSLRCTEPDLQSRARAGRNETELVRKSDVGRSVQFAKGPEPEQESAGPTQGLSRPERIQFDRRGAPTVDLPLHGARPEPARSGVRVGLSGSLQAPHVTDLDRSRTHVGRQRRAINTCPSRGTPHMADLDRSQAQLASQTGPAPEPDVAMTSRTERELTSPVRGGTRLGSEPNPSGPTGRHDSGMSESSTSATHRSGHN
jgi:hypothetical protein